ncbi:MAG: isomerase [Microbacteriaceae bacterium]|nr:isomerase [Microbacteriaceae bacterium]
MRVQKFATYSDDRGRLLPVEHADLPYKPSRVFVVTAMPAGTSRGDHAVRCRETIVLVSGGAEVHLHDAESTELEHFRLATPGDTVHLNPGDYVSYTLDDPASTVLVLAEDPYPGPSKGRRP